jgi:hypothetical protein
MMSRKKSGSSANHDNGFNDWRSPTGVRSESGVEKDNQVGGQPHCQQQHRHKRTNNHKSPSSVNYHRQALIREWTSLCQQWTTLTTTTTTTPSTKHLRNGKPSSTCGCTLATGGLGPWVYLPFQRAKSLLLEHDDGAYDADSSSLHRQEQQDQQQSVMMIMYRRQQARQLLYEARDAAIECLRSIKHQHQQQQEQHHSDKGHEYYYDPPSTILPTTSSSLMSMSMFTNPVLACHGLLAAIFHQLGRIDDTMAKKTAIEDNDNDPKIAASSSSLYHMEQSLQVIQRCFRHRQVSQKQAHVHSWREAATPNTAAIPSAFCTTNKDADMDCDCSVWTGKAGGIQSILWLRNELEDSTIGHSLVVELAREILLEGYHNESSRSSMAGATPAAILSHYFDRNVKVIGGTPPTSTPATLFINKGNRKS